MRTGGVQHLVSPHPSRGVTALGMVAWNRKGRRRPLQPEGEGISQGNPIGDDRSSPIDVTTTTTTVIIISMLLLLLLFYYFSKVRQNYASELKVRTDMEMLLRQCVEDVRQEIARRHIESAQFSNNLSGSSDLSKLYSKQPGMIPIDEFTQEDRERVLELLLSQERVVSLIYAKTFPVASTSAPSGKNMGPTLASDNMHPDIHVEENNVPSAVTLPPVNNHHSRLASR